MEMLQMATETMLDNYKKESKEMVRIRYVSTILAKIYVINQETRLLASMFNDENVNSSDVCEFIEKGIEIGLQFYPSLAVMKTHKGDLKNAVLIWKKLYESSNLLFFLEEASYTLRECII